MRRSPRQTTRTPPTRATRAHKPGASRYWELATRPLHILAFLTPLIAVYEIGAATVLGAAAAGVETVRAHERLARALDVLGVAGAILPWVVLVTILVVAHLISRDPWRVRLGVLLGMVCESCVATLPLLVLAALLFRAQGGDPTPALALTAPALLGDLPWSALAVLSIGAGLYEELVFRMIMLAAIHMVLSDFARLGPNLAGGIAIVASAVAFAVYHDLSTDVSALAQSAFYVLAGMYFGLIFVLRGFGVVVGVHALYDFLVLVVL